MMRALDDEQRWTARGLILGMDWQEEALLGRKAEQWTGENLPWVERVNWGQWEGLRRCGENARDWEEYRKAVEAWLSEPEHRRRAKTGETRPARRAWNLGPLRSGQPGLKESLMSIIEEASRPQNETSTKLSRFLDDYGFNETEKNEIDQLLRARRARRFVELLALSVRLKQKEAEQCWASMY